MAPDRLRHADAASTVDILAAVPPTPARSFVLASLRALHVDGGCEQTAIATVKKTMYEERRCMKSIAVDHDLLSR
jgi:hypothetical protein